MNKTELLGRWTKEKSEELYGIKNWGAGYFSISDKGEVIVSPYKNNNTTAISLMDIISGVRERGLDMPVLLRFENLLDSQISYLNNSFNEAMKNLNYKGVYRGVYPIKVNQQQQVVEEVTRFGQNYHHGLEVGSKAELVAALSLMKDKEACLICNGYKDEEFIDLGLYAVKMGFKCFFVIEFPGELDIILERSKVLGVQPYMGIRIKLSAKAGGHWTESGGDRSIFGLNMSQLIEMVDILKEHNMLDCLKLLHYHLGSQIPNIQDIRSAVLEAARVYAELVNEGAPMGYLDLGGGLAVDYDGSNTNYAYSRNYTVEEYCTDVVEAVMSIMDSSNIPHPVIITESGRTTVAYHSVLVFNVLDVEKFEEYEIPDKLDEKAPEQIKNLFEVSKNISLKNIQECYNDALYYRDEIRDMFKHGRISLRDRAFSERIFWNIINHIAKEKQKLKHAPPELEDIESAIADTYYCNFSVFQSIPDSWAIDQLFPIMPLHRLLELPKRNAVIADITCDCDGKIDRFIDLHDVRKSLPLHEMKNGDDYYLGVFLVGAYQETLGDLHNLFGDTNVVSVRINPDGTYELVKEIHGDSVSDVLSYVEFDPKAMLVSFREKAEEAVRAGLITASERKEIMRAYDNGMRGYTYYER
ncbi:arginine decarboxylase [Clostridium thermosuccinogenes]|jgi:arginine decarboxylase|uniref:Biosynthetic arginine decarboxylase n=1 Tax=Clostridium thermosuccinogenes TaxID=84032 RepID=A0A2K2FJ87_9CLOT|nr:biosynthetic arginine decarboxylase [Pseudoclostridium thermosuccinogenes]AUS96861.1 arginine decarboxylase [Pseudoclostridium thermosuccinogenes]PNT92472.1 arginine decarboxylase [Pseudoclostridium thermosuccinogenes]PNT96988.1 arginine decarboxylase [Pseudoclostridium thermosuccinogenes]PNT98847.1 arginine decarboxylase [Pseudoclostridium thermosuccinogenes]